VVRTVRPLTVAGDLRAALPGWIAARVVVAAAWVVNAVVVELRFEGIDPVVTDQGLFAWDGSYYRAIAELGYAATEADGIRFHPLVPMLGVNGVGILLLANVTALLAGALVHRLTIEVTGDGDLARRSATLLALAPPAFTLVWAYAEGPFLLLSAAHLLALHRRRWWPAAALGFLAVLTRPSGLLLAVPASVEAWKGWRSARAADRLGRAAAVLAPVAGLGAFLLWVEEATGDWALPLRIQDDFRDGFVVPPLRLLEGLGEVVTDPLGDGLHVPFAFGMIALAWWAWRHLPRSWGALAVVTVASNLAAGNLNSIERYAFGAVPLVIAFAGVAGGRWWRPAVVLSTAAMFAMAVLAWQGELVP
jgi:hypothetical protein